MRTAVRAALVTALLAAPAAMAEERSPAPLADFRLQMTLRAHDTEIRGLCFTPDGGYLVSASLEPSPLASWSARTGHMKEPARQPGALVAIAMASGRAMAAALDADGRMGLWPVAEGDFGLWAMVPTHVAGARAISATKDGARLAIAGNDGVAIWDTEQARVIRTLPARGGARAVAFSPDGSRLAVAAEGNVLALWDLATGSARSYEIAPAEQDGRPVALLSLAWRRDGRVLATGHSDGTVRVWDVKAERQLLALQIPAAAASVAFDPADGRVLASGHADGNVYLWNTAARAALRVLATYKREVRGLAFSPDGHALAAGSEDGTILFWRDAPLPEPE